MNPSGGAPARDGPHIFVQIRFVDDLFADERFEHVLQGNNAGEAAVLIDDAENVLPLLYELIEQEVSRRGLRYETKRFAQGLHRGGESICRKLPDNVVLENKPDPFLRVFTVKHRDARMLPHNRRL